MPPGQEKPINADLQQTSASIVDHPGRVLPARIGMRWGALFSLPIVLPLLLLAAFSYAGNVAGSKVLQLVVPVMPSIFLLIFAGRWWATRGLDASEWMFLLTAIAQGLALFLSFFLAFAAVMWFDGDNLLVKWTWSDFESAFDGWGICSAWTFALGAVVVWRVRRAARLKLQRCTPKADGDTSGLRPEENAATHAVRPIPENGLRRFAVALIVSLGLPVLLSVPAVLLLRYDTSLRQSGNAILMSHIGAIDAHILDLKDLNKVKSVLLARKQIVEVLETDAPRTADVLRVFGQLPSDVQLLSLEMKERHVALAIRCAAPSAELAVLELLAHSGYRDLRIASRQCEEDHADAHVSIEATSTRGDTK